MPHSCGFVFSSATHVEAMTGIESMVVGVKYDTSSARE
jgi:hypothetical protein